MIWQWKTTICSNISQPAQKTYSFLIEYGLVFAAFCKCAHTTQIGVDEGRNQIRSEDDFMVIVIYLEIEGFFRMRVFIHEFSIPPCGEYLLYYTHNTANQSQEKYSECEREICVRHLLAREKPDEFKSTLLPNQAVFSTCVFFIIHG